MEEMQRMKELVDILNRLSHEYYDNDNPTVSDAEYDALYDELLSLEASTGLVLPQSPTKRVGGTVSAGFQTVRHRDRLFSLDKSKTKEGIQEFIHRVSTEHGTFTPLTLEFKYDGLTLNLSYEKGHLIRIVTRGDGTEGEDVTLQALTIKDIPHTIPFEGSVDIQGECIMRLSALQAYNQTAAVPLKNARNAAAGGIRNLDPRETERRSLSFMAYNISYYQGGHVFATQEEVHEFLKGQGFHTGDFFMVVRDKDDWQGVLDHIEADIRPTLDYLIDGMVFKVNNLALREELGVTIKFPKWAIAYKFHAEEVVSTVEDVIWQVSRTGKLNPLARLTPVDIGGAIVQRATLSNISEIRRKDIRIGSQVFVRRSGDVIPEILGIARHNDYSVSVEAPTACPACGAPVIADGVFLYCSNANHCAPRVIATIEHFSAKDAMDIEGLSEKSIEQLYNELQVRTPADLYRLTKEDFLGLEGYKDKKAQNMVDSIAASRTPTLPRFLNALGIPNIGKKSAETLTRAFGSLSNIRSATYEQFIALEDFGAVMAEGVVAFWQDPANNELVDTLLACGVTPHVEERVTEGSFAGEIVVLTGTLSRYKRSQAGALIQAQGGQIADSISARVTLVVAGADAGSKLPKAQKLGIPIIDEEAFLLRLGETV